MRNIWIIFKKEFKAYFTSPIGFIFISAFTMFMSWYFFSGYFVIKQADMRTFFAILPWVFMFFIPAVSMRIWAEEKKLGTLELLFTLPISTVQATLGKFLASFAFMTLTIVLTLPILFTVRATGHPDMGPIIGGYIGAILMGAAFLSIGMFVSALTENQIIAFILGVAVMFAFIIIGHPIVLIKFPPSLTPILSFISLSGRFESIARGVIDTRDVIYYLSIIIFFLYVNIKWAEIKR